MEFKEQYRHPNWQRKRLEALEAAGYICQRCCDADTTLHVHHKRYIKGRMVWDYTLDELSVVCEPCHEEAHHLKDELQELLRLVPAAGGFDWVPFLVGYMSAKTGPCFIPRGELTERMFQADPYTETLGEAAAGIGEKLNIEVLMGLINFVRTGKPGEKFEIKIPVPHAFFKGIEF